MVLHPCELSKDDSGCLHNGNESETVLLHPNTDGDVSKMLEDKRETSYDNDGPKVEVEIENKPRLIYRVSQTPPVHLTFMFAVQQTFLNIASPLSVVMIVSEVACCQQDYELKIRILSATLFMAGLGTSFMTTFGVRLPIFQGPSQSYLIPLIAMQYLDEWKCPATYDAFDPVTNQTVLMAKIENGTDVPNREVALDMLAKMSGSLMVAGGLHFLLGLTGLVGILIRYVGPITIVPTIILIGIKLYVLIIRFSETDWIVSITVTTVNIILSLYLAKCKTPLPMWSKQRGFHIFWYPLHQVFSILLSIIAGWTLAAFLTSIGYYSDDPTTKQYLARTDARTFAIADTDWFIFPYPGQFGFFTFSVGAFINFTVATMMSVLDSIGDYAACARVAQVTPPPAFAFNRGLTVEGIMTTLSGAMGCCHACVSYGGNVGAMGITKVGSRRVFQVVGFFYMTFAVLGKFGAAAITIPYSVLGGIMLVMIGIFLGMLLSYLQTIDLNSTRNLAIIGITLLLGFAVPYWATTRTDAINTGNSELDGVISMMLSNPAFIGGVFACFLDNTVPGTLAERGLLAQMRDLDDEEAKKLAKSYFDGPEVYRLPFVPKVLRRSFIAKIFPIFDTSEEVPRVDMKI